MARSVMGKVLKVAQDNAERIAARADRRTSRPVSMDRNDGWGGGFMGPAH